MKLKNNIRKLLISLTLGIVFCSSFVAYPVKKAAAVDTCADTISGSQIYANKNTVYLDEDISLYAESPLPSELIEQCKNKDNIRHDYYFLIGEDVETLKQIGGITAGYREQLPGYVSRKDIKGKDLLLDNLQASTRGFYTITVKAISYGTQDSFRADFDKSTTIIVKNTNRGDNDENPTVNQIPDDVNDSGNGGKKTWNPDDLFVTVSGYSILRTVKGDPTNVPYTLKWGGASVDNHPILKDNIQRAQDKAISGTYEGLYGAVNYQGVTNLECGKKLDDFGCETGAIADGQNFGPPPFEDLVDMPWDKLFAAEYAANPSTSTKTFSKGFVLFPVVQIGLSNDTALTKGDFIKFVVEIYATDDDRIKACVAEQTKKNNTDAEAYCQDPKNKAVGGELQESTFTSSDDGTNAGVGGSIADFIAQVIGTIMWFVVGIIYNIFSIVIAPLIEISLAIHTYTDDFAKVILPGWELLRNLSNIFFIVILLAIGLATLFRVQKYQYRNLLLKLILAALLVNFSMVITQSVLAIAETVQSQFLPIEKNDDVVRTIAKSIMFAPFEQGTITPEVASKSLSESLSRLVFPFFYLSLSLMGFVVMGALAILLVVRFAVIWILLMTSPIAFVAWVLPATSKYTDQWLDNLFRYAFFVAIIGFFLNVIAFLAQRQGGVFQDLTDAQVTGWDGFLSRIATNLMILIFMIVAMGAAQSMKIAGGKYVSKIGQAAGKLPWKGLKAIGERGFEGVQNKTRLTLDPRIWKKDAEDYMAKLNDAKEGRLAKRRDAFILGSPKDFMNTFGTPDGIKKVGRSIKAKMKYNADAEKALRAQQDILTEDKRKENTDKQSKSEAKVRGLIGKYKRLRAKKMDQALDKDDIDSIQKTIKSRTESLNTEIADLTAKAEELKKNGGDPKTIAKIQATRDEKIKQRNAIDKTAKDLETQITAGGAIDLTAIRGIDKVFDSEEAAQQARDLLKAERGDFVKLRRTSKKDDALRTANGFDAYNATPPPGYKAFTEADSERVKKQYQDIEILNAQRKANSRNYQDQYDRRKQGEKTKELEESGIEESRQWLGIYHKAEAEGDKNTAVAAMKWLAKDGSFGDLLKSKNKGVDYNGMVSFFKEDFKPKFKIDDQSLFRLGAEIGKINEGKKQFTLSKVVSVGLNGPSGWKDESAYMSDLGKKLGTAEPRELTKMHKYAFMNEGVDGKGRVHEAGQNALESLRTSEDVKSIKGGMSIATAKSIIGSSNYANLRLSPEIRRALEERAAKSRVK